MNIAAYIDHTYLKPQGTDKEISALCSEAKEYGFYSVCVNPCWIPLCRELLTGSSVKIAAVVGFPLGAMSTESKAFEVQQAKKAGADEIDMVINIGFLKAGMYDEVLNDIKAVVLACRPEVLLKVIIENCLLTDDEKIRACETAVKAGAHFVKTSTGFNGEGATVQDVALMRKTVGPDIGVKAAGGVRTYEDAVEMIEAGATRIGTSGGVQIIQGRPHTDGY